MKTLLRIFFVLALLISGGGSATATVTYSGNFPTTANIFQDGDIINAGDWNNIENAIGIRSTTSTNTLFGRWNDLFSTTSMPQLTTLLNLVNLKSTNATTTNATTTSLFVLGQAASSGNNCLQIDTNGLVTKTGSACAVSGTVTVNTGSLNALSYYSATGAISATSSQPLYVGSLNATSSTLLSGFGTSSPWGFLSLNPNGQGIGVPEFVIGSSTATHLLVDGSGNVGIATTSPQATLAVVGTGYITSRLGIGTNSQPIAAESLAIYAASGDVYQSVSSGAVQLISGIISSLGTIGTYSNHSFFIGTNNAERIRVMNTGLIGLASTTPYGLFSINPNAIGSAPAFVIGSSTATHLIVTNGGIAGIASTTPTEKAGLVIATSTIVTGGVACPFASTTQTINGSLIDFNINWKDGACQLVILGANSRVVVNATSSTPYNGQLGIVKVCNTDVAYSVTFPNGVAQRWQGGSGTTGTSTTWGGTYSCLSTGWEYIERGVNNPIYQISSTTGSFR